MKRFASVLLLALLTIAFSNARAELSDRRAVITNGLSWDSMDKMLKLPGMTNIVRMTFYVTNTSTEEITILSTETTCECTVVDTSSRFPWTIAPNEGGAIKVNVNTRGMYGKLDKSIAVKTSRGVENLGIHLDIPLSPAPFNRSVREQDVEAAKANRQAIFQGHCAPCHSWPTKNLMGEALFVTACGICHTSDHRADFVPNLAALKGPLDEKYWKEIVIHGKPGTMMPAFADTDGGVLDKYQVHSLVQFLLNKYPSKTPVAAASAGATAR